ncbi:MAG: general secretion pathway protein GspA [Deltaproteobacteria bacterium]|nr:MAG: general secretion pathway protein GspA [Deltaproteobacteria bacterium]
MYRKFFGLKKRPFILSPDPEFLYLSRVHDLALTHLEYGIVHNVGFLALTGDVGAGKTTLLKYLFEKVKDSLDIAMVFNTNLDPASFLEMLTREFELNPSSNSKTDLFDALADHFISEYSKGNRCVVIVDEAQNLPTETFEELRMLSNLEVGSDFLLQIILVGQPQLRERLSDHSLSQLAQRISVHFHLTPLPLNEVGEYINHRLKIAGYSDPDPLFLDDAIEFIGQLSKGIPRVINSICDACLTYAFADDLKQVSKQVVERVIKDNELLVAFIEEKTCKEDEQTVARPVNEVSSEEMTNLRDLLAKVLGRLEALEMRVNMLETAEKDKLVGVLQAMLAKERERSQDLEQKVIALGYKYKELQRKVSSSGSEEAEDQFRIKRKNSKFWEVFGGKK